MSALTQMREAPSANPIERLLAATAADMAKVNELILSRAQSHVEMVPELARYLIDSGGKRLRPMLTVAAASLFDQGTGTAINFAAAVEFMHNATLLHDDVVDESDMRRFGQRHRPHLAQRRRFADDAMTGIHDHGFDIHRKKGFILHDQDI